MTKLEAFTQYMSQFAAHRGADMQWVMDASSHGRIFSYAWDEATRIEKEACAKVCEQAGVARQWQGLTEEEVSEILDREIGFNSCFGPETDFARAIEAKLKEKNT
jgi:hypothetical protein